MRPHRSTCPPAAPAPRWWAAWALLPQLALAMAPAAENGADIDAQAPAPEASAPSAQQVQVRGQRAVDVGPMPGLLLTRDQIPANLQSANAKEIRASRALNVAEYLNTQMQGVSVNDYAGNPFQLDLNYRGFTAGSQVGTPQGLSVFFDGVRVNEPFGDVVNWDLIPMNAIERFDLFPGSNPLFGLNTLGGAISVRSKSGFSAPGVDASVTTGSWQRRQLQLSGGANDGERAAFGALTLFREGGWRDDSPSQVGQLFGRGDWALARGALTASLLASDNQLVGNGLVPIELARQRPSAVYTSPDQSRNQLLQWSLSAAFDVTDQVNLTSRIYRRQSRRKGYNGDAYEDFQDFGARDRVSDFRRVNPSLPICQFQQLDASGAVNLAKPLNGPVGVGCGLVTYAASANAGRRRNGGFLNAEGVQESGVADGGTPTGLMTRTTLNQVADGLGLQMNWNLKQHKAMVGASLDRNRADYLMTQRLGLIDAAHRVYESPDHIAPQFGAAFTDVVGNQFGGTQRTHSLYASEVWSPRENLHLSVAGRYNRTDVDTRTGSRTRFYDDLADVAGSLPSYIVCPSSDPKSCPAAPVSIVDPAKGMLAPTVDTARYTSFNPSLGVNWLPTPEINVFGNLSRGSRAPSVVELGCALDLTLVPLSPGHPELGVGPRSLVGSACSLPSTLSGDPYLPQIRATSAELGLRGRLDAHWEWNASVYRTDLHNDIYFVGAGAGRSYFDTIGKTRRRGIEMGIKGSDGPFDVSASYAFVDATFQSRFYMLSPNNSSADFDQNSRTKFGDISFFDGSDSSAIVLLPSASAGDNRGLGTFRNILVQPGARMPGVAAHNLNLSAGWQPVPELHMGLTMVARSGSFMRGNDNNQHRAGGTDQQIGQYYCSANNCALTGFEQIPVPAGRRFTQGGRTPGYAHLNLDLKLALSQGFELGLQVTNLLNRRYITAGRLGVNPFSPPTVGETDASGWNYNASEWQNTSFVAPAAPRAYFLTLSYSVDLK